MIIHNTIFSILLLTIISTNTLNGRFPRTIQNEGQSHLVFKKRFWQISGEFEGPEQTPLKGNLRRLAELSYQGEILAAY